MKVFIQRNILFFLVTFFSHISAEWGLITVPVADLMGEPIQTLHPHQSVYQSYTQIPWAGFGARHHTACPRVHQALFNEQVKIIGYQKDEVHIEVISSYYFTHTSHKPHNDYWTLKQNVTPLTKLQKDDINHLPLPIDFSKKAVPTADVITLVKPFYDATTHTTYSAGTRFMLAHKKEKNSDAVIFIYNPQSKSTVTTTIPADKLYSAESETPHEQIIAFLNLIKQWINHPETIAYVWGGCSFIESHPTNNFETKKRTLHDTIMHYYARPQEQTIKTGMDCSGLILRAAQVVGMPYYLKNTYTLAQKLTPLTASDAIQAGDLIWTRGHVMIVANLTRNTVYEARSYDGGYGKLQELKIKKIFKGINTFADLKTAYLNKSILERINIRGATTDRYPEFKILKMTSIWD